MLKKRLDWKDKLNFNIQTSQPGYDTTYIAQYLLPHIARSKGSQTMKCGQLIEYKKRNMKYFSLKLMQKIRHGN